MSKYVKLFNAQGLPLGFRDYDDVSSAIGDANVKVYDEKGNTLGVNRNERIPPRITYQMPEVSPSIIGEQVPFVWQDDMWVATEDEFAYLQFLYLDCTQDEEYDLNLTIEGQIEIDEEACTKEGFPYAVILRTTSNAGGEVSGMSPQGAWKIIYPIA